MDTIRVRFLGGTAGHLTGSCTLIIINQGKDQTKILVDAGLIQGKYQDNLRNNLGILGTLKPSEIDIVVVTHPHVDHIGRLPLMVREGFRGRIICTAASAAIMPPMLIDSAKIQKSEARRGNKARRTNSAPEKQPFGHDHSGLWLGQYDKGKKKGKCSRRRTNGRSRPLYDEADVEKTRELIKNDGYEYGEWIRLAKKISLKFYRSGHILGGAIALIRVSGRGRKIYLAFSGDLGQAKGFILQPPEIISEDPDFLFIEATYGGLQHPERQEEISQFTENIKTALERNGKVLIPSFVLERSQEMIYLLSFLITDGQLPNVKIFLDSPLAEKLTNIFSKTWDEALFSDEYQLGFNPFNVKTNSCLQIVNSRLDSEELISTPGPYIVIAGSGDCDAGRIREHLRVGLNKEKNLVCLVGYLQKHSLGRRLKDGTSNVFMNHKPIKVSAQIASFGTFSAHADSPFLVEYAASIIPDDDRHDRKIFVVHGGVEEAAALKQALIQSLPVNGWDKNIVIPQFEEEMILLNDIAIIN